MKLSILLAGSILTSAIVGNAYAQTCGAQPSCSSLGYTYTGSTSDCVNTPMKCPFNTSYFNCTKKADALAKLQADIVTAAMPNYSKMEWRAKGQEYIAETNGFIIGYDTHRFDSGSNWQCNSTDINITINGRNVRLSPSQTNWAINSWSYPIKKGSKYRVSGGHQNVVINYNFVPSI